MFWTSVLELGSPNMFWILVLSSCFGSWTSHSALELRFLILFWHLVRPACIAICCDIVLQVLLPEHGGRKSGASNEEIGKGR